MFSIILRPGMQDPEMKKLLRDAPERTAVVFNYSFLSVGFQSG